MFDCQGILRVFCNPLKPQITEFKTSVLFGKGGKIWKYGLESKLALTFLSCFSCSSLLLFGRLICFCSLRHSWHARDWCKKSAAQEHFELCAAKSRIWMKKVKLWHLKWIWNGPEMDLNRPWNESKMNTLGCARQNLGIWLKKVKLWHRKRWMTLFGHHHFMYSSPWKNVHLPIDSSFINQFSKIFKLKTWVGHSTQCRISFNFPPEFWE